MRFSANEHLYLSTACLHGVHDYCVAPVVSRDGSWQVIGPSYSAALGDPKTPAQCKFCTAICRCRCHIGVPAVFSDPDRDIAGEPLTTNRGQVGP